MAWWIWALIAYFGLNFIIAIIASMVFAGMHYSVKNIIKMFFILLFAGLPLIIYGIILGERLA